MSATVTRGYFGIGVEGVSKPMNVGSLMRSAHALGASFVFTVAAACPVDDMQSDTSDAHGQVPFYRFDSVKSMCLPDGCALVGVELTDDAVDLPSFRHPRCAAYVLGMERGSLSPALTACLDHVVRIPTGFALNLAVAGAIVMYDRMLSTRRFSERPLMPGGRVVPPPPPVFGEPLWKKKQRRRTAGGAPTPE
jgi:tRNA G18 (ribose-2'-O)-methylase SpoU